MKKEYAKRLASVMSIIPCNAKKVPLEKGWTKNECKTPEEVFELKCQLYGCRGGYKHVECVDVDLKVFASQIQRKEWWAEFYGLLCDNILDFDKKVVIARTISGGFHLIYKNKNVAKNTKIAKLKDMNEAIIETRGIGGQFILYDTFLNEKEYHDISYISDEERQIIWEISKSYDYIKPSDIFFEKTEKRQTDITRVSPWADFNTKHSCLELLSSDFDVVGKTSTSYIVRRKGAKSASSGYIYRDSGGLYLFSTATIYPANTLLSPASIYAWKHHNGDFSKTAKELYALGYGDRIMPKTIPILEQKKIIEEKINDDTPTFPIEVFPIHFANFIKESNETLGLSIDYMGCSLLWVFSIVIGNTMQMEVETSWREPATIWIALVGEPGIGKTPSVNHIISPLRELNIREQRNYKRNYKKYEEFEKLDKKEKERTEEIKKPVNQQFIVSDVTIEALFDLHEDNPKGLGIFKDELAGWFKDMNKYRAGSDLEAWLSSWSGSPANLTRKTTKSAFVDRPFLPVIGGIQPSIYERHLSGENKENGFVDRVLTCYPLLKVNKYSRKYMSAEAIRWYSDTIQSAKHYFDNLFMQSVEDEKINSIPVRFSDGALVEWERIYNDIADMQNCEDQEEHIKSMLPKQRSYIPRFCLILNAMQLCVHRSVSAEIEKETLLKAEKLSKYFIAMAQRIKVEKSEFDEIKEIIRDKKTKKEKIIALYNAKPDFNRTKCAEIIGVSRQYVLGVISDNK